MSVVCVSAAPAAVTQKINSKVTCTTLVPVLASVEDSIAHALYHQEIDGTSTAAYAKYTDVHTCAHSFIVSDFIESAIITIVSTTL